MQPLNPIEISEQPKIKWRQKYRLLCIFGWVMAGVIGVLLLVVVAGTIFFNTKKGQSYLVHKVSALSNHTVAISGLTGFLPDHARIELIQVKDPRIGVWLEVRQAQLDWFSLALLFKTISIDTLSAKEIDVYALPPPKDKGHAPQDADKPKGYPTVLSLVIEHLKIGKLFVSSQIAHADLIAGVNGRVTMRDIMQLHDVSVLKDLFRKHPSILIWKDTQEPDFYFNGTLQFGLDKEGGVRYRTTFGPVRFDVMLPTDQSSYKNTARVYIGLGEAP